MQRAVRLKKERLTYRCTVDADRAAVAGDVVAGEKPR